MQSEYASIDADHLGGPGSHFRLSHMWRNFYLTLPHLSTHVDISAAGPLRIGTEMLNSRNIQWPVGHNFPFYFEAEAMQLRANLIANITNAFMMLTPP